MSSSETAAGAIARRLFPVTDRVADPSTIVIPPSLIPSLNASTLEYATLSRLRSFIGHHRTRWCPPTSYGNARSSSTLIDAFGQCGFAAIAMVRRTDVFTVAVTCDNDREHIAAVDEIVRRYGLENRIVTVNESVYDYLQTAFAVKTPNAIIYWDLHDDGNTAAEQPIINANKDDYDMHETQREYGQTLSEYATYLLSRPLCPVPMIVFKVPKDFNTKRLCVSGKHSVVDALSSEYQFVAIAGNNGVKQSANNLTSTVSTPPVFVLPADPYSAPLPVTSRHQIRWLYHATGEHLHLRLRLRQIMSTQLKGAPRAQEALWQTFTQIMNKRKSDNTPAAAVSDSQSGIDWSNYLDDEDIYIALHTHYHKVILKTAECVRQREQDAVAAKSDGRANSRVTEIVNLIRPTLPHPHSLLDIGCSEGSITASLAATLKVSPANAHGSDVRQLTVTDGFTFHLVSDSLLPFCPDESIHLITALMSLHHIPDVIMTIREVYRAAAPGALLVIREHDCVPATLSTLIDVMHGLYARVWSDPPEMPSFCDSYYALYRPRHEWTSIITSVGFVQLHDSPDRAHQKWDRPRNVRDGDYIPNPFHFYYGVYQKPSRSTVITEPTPTTMRTTARVDKRRAEDLIPSQSIDDGVVASKKTRFDSEIRS